jgi:hypothetical protein
MEFKGSLPCIQEPTTGIYLEPDENNGVFLTYFCTKIFYALLFSPRPAQIILLDLIIIIIFDHGAQIKLPLCSFLQPHVTSSLLGLTILLSTLFSNTKFMFFPHCEKPRNCSAINSSMHYT